MSADELSNLEIDITATGERLSLNRRLLAEQLAPHGAGPDLLDELLTATEEWGAPEVIRQLGEAPGAWRLTTLSPARFEVVGKLLTLVDDDNRRFDWLIAAREDIRAAEDPGHRRVYAWFGRELVIDDDGRQLRFADTAAPEPAALLRVPNRTAPVFGPDNDPGPQRLKRRERDR